jgi:hypothetical protein
VQLVAGGALLFLLLAVVGHLVAARRNRRPRTGQEIARAVGSALLGAVDVPVDESAARRDGRGPGGRTGRLLGVDAPWDAPEPRVSGDEAGRRIRYRRVCARLRDLLPAPRRLLVVVPDGDETARLAAARLVAEAGGDPLLRVAEVAVDRPTVPDDAGGSGALLVLGTGGRTAGELAGLAEACAEAGHELVGVVVAAPVLDPRGRTADRAPRHAAPEAAVAGPARGGSV